MAKFPFKACLQKKLTNVRLSRIADRSQKYVPMRIEKILQKIYLFETYL
jgi:hypothetical protein